jgi:hypothetical protein
LGWTTRNVFGNVKNITRRCLDVDATIGNADDIVVILEPPYTIYVFTMVIWTTSYMQMPQSTVM